MIVKEACKVFKARNIARGHRARSYVRQFEYSPIQSFVCCERRSMAEYHTGQLVAKGKAAELGIFNNELIRHSRNSAAIFAKTEVNVGASYGNRTSADYSGLEDNVHKGDNYRKQIFSKYIKHL